MIRRTLLAIVALVVIAMASTAQAETIQALLLTPANVGVTDNGDGTFTYHYQVELTANNGLTGSGSFQSGLIIIDFQGLIQPDVRNKLTVAGSDVTAVSDWTLDTTQMTGGGALPNVTYAAGTTTVTGTSNVSSASDGNSLNVVMIYKGADLGLSGSPRDLIHLDLVSKYGTYTPDGVDTLSRDTTSTKQPAEGFAIAGPVAPLPAPAIAGLALLTGFGGLKLRKRNALA